MPSVVSPGFSQETSWHSQGILELHRMNPTAQQRVAVFQHIGGRKSQEDRFALCPDLTPGREHPENGNFSFYGVFDGTVGDFASDTVKDLVVPMLQKSEGFRDALALMKKIDGNGADLQKEDEEAARKEAEAATGSETDAPATDESGDAKAGAGAGKRFKSVSGRKAQRTTHLTNEQQTELKKCLEAAFTSMYIRSDEELLRLAGKQEIPRHYASSTSVTLMLYRDLFCVGHLGDSRICLISCDMEYVDEVQKRRKTSGKAKALGQDPEKQKVRVLDCGKNERLGFIQGQGVVGVAGQQSIALGQIPLHDMEAQSQAEHFEQSATQMLLSITGTFLTADHKPDNVEERQRIEARGGSVERLNNHANKPFIRGGDFQHRKMLGESPMQLQYSRAFGGKDLKPFGLLGEPTVNVHRRSRNTLGFILASDGLWDVLSAKDAAKIAFQAYMTSEKTEESPSQALVQNALHDGCDNITAVTVFFDEMGNGCVC